MIEWAQETGECIHVTEIVAKFMFCSFKNGEQSLEEVSVLSMGPVCNE